MKQYESHAFYQFLNSTKYTLFDAYKNPSCEKRKIYAQIMAGMERVGGKHFRILSHNGYRFSCAYLYKLEGIVYLAVFTPTKNFDIDVTDTVLGVQI